MNAVQLHLALNHLPIVGLFAFAAVLFYALWRGSRELRTVALVGIAISGLMAWPVGYTGHEAEEVVEHLQGVSEALIERHEDAAEVTGNLAILTGIAALLLLGLERWAPRFRRPATVGLLVLVLVSATGVGWAGHLGGLIRHPELRDGDVVAQLEAEAREGGEDDDDDGHGH